MNRRNLENILKLGMFAGLTAVIIAHFGLSFFKPNKGLEEVLSRELHGGNPKQVISKYEETTLNYAVGLFYPANNGDYSAGNRPSNFFPTDVFRFEYNEDTRKSVFVQREGQKQENPVMGAGKKYTVQFTCPHTMKSVYVSYNGIEQKTRIIQDEALKKANLLVVKANFSPVDGVKYLKAEIVYRNGERNIFNIPITGK